MMVTLKALAWFGLKLETCCVVIQGFSNAGGMAAKVMSANGFKIVSIVEYDGGLQPQEPRYRSARPAPQETGTINGFSGGEELDKDQTLFLESDVLLPAETENVITSLNADKLSKLLNLRVDAVPHRILGWVSFTRKRTGAP
jgi:glutamate dehydrogenase (NAD(P)+)